MKYFLIVLLFSCTKSVPTFHERWQREISYSKVPGAFCPSGKYDTVTKVWTQFLHDDPTNTVDNLGTEYGLYKLALNKKQVK